MNIYRIISEALTLDPIAIELDSPADESIIDKIMRASNMSILQGFVLLDIDGYRVAAEVDTTSIDRAKPEHQAIRIARFERKDMRSGGSRAYRFDLDLFYNRATHRFELYRYASKAKVSPAEWQNIIRQHQNADKYRT